MGYKGTLYKLEQHTVNVACSVLFILSFCFERPDNQRKRAEYILIECLHKHDK